MPQISVNDLRNGITLELDNGLFQVVEFQHVKPGKGGAFVRTKIRNVRNGAVIDKTFNAGIKVEQAIVDRQDMQFLYKDGGEYVFMNTSTYDQMHVPQAALGDAADYLTEQMIAQIAIYQGEIIGNLYRYCPFIHSAVMYRKEPILRMGGYSRYAHNFEDYLLWVQLLKTGKCCNLPEPLIKVRINPSSVTIDEKWRGRRFRQLKLTILQRGVITREEGDELWSIIQRQDNRKIKEGAYHALCGKKLLANNYMPARARWHVAKAIHANPFRLDNYLLLSVSFLPRGWIKWLHRISPGKI